MDTKNPPFPGGPSEAPLRVLEIEASLGPRRRLPLTGRRVVIGRTADAEVRLDYPGVSRQHAELMCDPFGRWWVRDLDSRNGTWVNGFTISERILEPSDQVQIGECVLRLTLPETADLADPFAGDQPVKVTESDSDYISSLEESSAGRRISAHHLSTLMAFGEQLQSVESAAERMRMLCMLMVSPEFHGHAAVVLRVNRQQQDAAPRTLCTPQWAREVKNPSLHISRSMLAAMSQHVRPLVAGNAAGKGDLQLSIAELELAAMACPLRTNDQVIDVLYQLLPPVYATEEWLALANLASEHFRHVEFAWSARRQARINALIEHDLERAREIQTRLVPVNPQIPGLDLAISFQPSRWVGGDYADVLALPGGKALLVVADVCGKGLPAALVTASLHTIVHIAVRAGSDICQLADLLNDHLREHLPNDRFVSGLLIELEPGTGRMQCVNAGHPSPLLVRFGGQVETLNVSPQPPWGVQSGNYSPRSLKLEPDQVLAIFTDGITEMRDDGGCMLSHDRFGDDLRTILSGSPPPTARQAADLLVSRLSQYLGDRLPADDRTFLLARLLSGG